MPSDRGDDFPPQFRFPHAGRLGRNSRLILPQVSWPCFQGQSGDDRHEAVWTAGVIIPGRSSANGKPDHAVVAFRDLFDRKSVRIGGNHLPAGRIITLNAVEVHVPPRCAPPTRGQANVLLCDTYLAPNFFWSQIGMPEFGSTGLGVGLGPEIPHHPPPALQ